MAYSYVTPTANGVTTQFSVPFDYLRKAHVQCTVDGVQKDITWVNDTLIQLAVAPAAASEVIIKRVTPQGSPLVDFADGSTLVAADLDAANLQLLYIAQELQDYNDGQTVLGPNDMLRWVKTATASQTLFSGADDTSQALTYTVGLEQVYNNGILLIRGTEYTATNGTSITLATGAAAGNKVQVLAQRQYSVAVFPGSNLVDESITTSKLAALAVTLAKLADNSVNSAKIVDGSIVNADVNASAAIAGSKVNPNFSDQTIQTNLNLLVGGTATISGDVTLNSTGSIKVPAGSTVQRPTPVAGMIRYNADNSEFEGYGATWGGIGSGAKGGGTDRVFFENGQTVTTDYTLTASRNAVTAGPITINSGVTVTVPSGSSWVVV
jgi:hypothetical protein